MKKLKTINYFLLVAILAVMSLMFLSGCSSFKGDSSLMVTTGQGEYKNRVRTDRTEITARKNIGNYHLIAKHESLNSKAIDDDSISLVDGDRTSLGVGVHTDRGTDFTVFFSDDDLWSMELIHRTEPIRWGLYPVVGITHLDSLKRKQGIRRKTTSAIVGFGYSFNNNVDCEATVTTRNNGAQFVDDYVQFGCGYKF